MMMEIFFCAFFPSLRQEVMFVEQYPDSMLRLVRYQHLIGQVPQSNNLVQSIS